MWARNKDHQVGQGNCEKIILDLCSTIGIKLSDGDIERAHRIGSPMMTKRPILVRFNNYKDRQSILNMKHKLKSRGIDVQEDFPVEVQMKRRKLAPIVHAAYRSGKHKATLVGDKVLLDGKLYSCNDLDRLPDELKPENLSTLTSNNKIAFFTCNSKLSNHYSCEFTVRNNRFTSVEQYLMFSKANTFGDTSSCEAVMNTTDPVQAKSIGKRIRNFKKEEWNKVRDSHMHIGLTAKFTQNADLGSFLKQTGQKLLIEANQSDSYWEVGLPLGDKDVWEPKKWKGENKLGLLLCEV